MTADYHVHTLSPSEHPRWERFVEQCPEATFFHRAGWQTVLEQAFGHRTWFYYVERNGEIVGVLPLARVKSLLFGDTLSSTPFCVYGGVASTDETARTLLEQTAQELARTLGVQSLELRHQTLRHPEWAVKTLYHTFKKPFSPDPEHNLLAIPRKQRAEVRKGIQAGLTGVEERDLDRCYALYSASVHALGTPIFTRRYFHLLQATFGSQFRCLTIQKQGEPLAAVASFYFRDQVLPYYGGGLPQGRSCGAAPFMYWELMTQAGQYGASQFDFGRSKQGTGSFEFKRLYGFTPQQLYYEYDLVRATAMPELNPLNPKYRLFINYWKKLPLPIAEWIGPWLARNLG